MSYDLSIYGTTRPSLSDVVDLVRSAPKLTPTWSGADDREAGMVRVSRGKQQLPGFTIDGPFMIEAEDVPVEVTAQVLGVKWLYRVSVEEISDKTVADAERISRRLAKQACGVLFDEQTDQLWPKSSQRKVSRPKDSGLTEQIELRWCYRVDDAPDDFAACYLRLARQYLPEALPRRYGSSEPFQGNLERDGDTAFVDYVDMAASTTTYMAAKFPVISGGFQGKERFPCSTRFISLAVDRETFSDPSWREALMKFFNSLAIELRCFFASGEVLRPGRTTTRGITSYQMLEEGYYPSDHQGKWLGLPSYPIWWSWYAEPYAKLVRRYLPDAIQNPDGSLFHSWKEDSADRDQLLEAQPHPSSDWIPSELAQQHGDAAVRPAAVIPVEYAE